jgi:hypothetical protein
MSKSTARYRRSILISIVALGSLIWVATDQFGIPRENIGWMLIYTLGAMGCIILTAGIAVALWIGVKKLLGR